MDVYLYYKWLAGLEPKHGFVTLSRQSISEYAAYICGKLRLHDPKEH